eukprot:TRINITY_DN5020_c0_g4_i5.p2 TRINITY_DN5020_c0_g4~~TRINITY_DN5020_c0_g4_i5.p2  ORF type:complete len:250 (+),score=63.69 TRINITY_DN5020_c0_g4_i5:808-1557(+)
MVQLNFFLQVLSINCLLPLAYSHPPTTPTRAVSLPIHLQKDFKAMVKKSQILFTPSLSSEILVTNRERPPSLTTLVQFLKNCLGNFEEIVQEQEEVAKKFDQLSEKELTELGKSEHGTPTQGEYTSAQLQALAQQRLSQEQLQASSNKSILYYVIENILLLLWSHLYQFINSKPIDESLQLPPSVGKKTVTPLTGLTIGQKDVLKKKAIDVLINEANTLEKLEKLPQMRQVHLIKMLAKKIQELLRCES